MDLYLEVYDIVAGINHWGRGIGNQDNLRNLRPRCDYVSNYRIVAKYFKEFMVL